MMDPTSIKLINLLQKGLPIEKDPYGIMAEQLGISRTELVSKIKELYQEGYIRRIGGTFDNARMGYTSVLFGACVPDQVLNPAAAYVNSFKGVTHNYLRTGRLNMWFTFSFSDQEEKERLVKGFQERFEIAEIYEFPKLRNYKLNVFFDLEDR
jgi:DNA-binding Lrp family transcriptional regulator